MKIVNRCQYAINVWQVKDYIKHAQTNILNQDTNRFFTMQNIFKKLYLRHLQDYQQLSIHLNSLNNYLFISQSPTRAIAQYFHKKSKHYSQDFLRATFDAIGKAHQISKRDNAGSLDVLGYKLYHSSEFSNLSEELKYGLRNNKIGFANLVVIIEGLINLQYIDYEIFNLLLLYTKREIICGDQYAQLKDWQGDREFQIEKKDYYKPVNQAILDGLRQSDEVSSALSFIRHIYEENQKENAIKQQLKQQNIEELNRLINEISETNKNFRKIVEGIINVRREYVKMVNISSDEQILRNPNLNLDLLQIQQKLISLKLIDLHDIRNIKQMSNSQYEIKRIQQVILLYLNVKRLDPIFSLIHPPFVQVAQYTDKADVDCKKVTILLSLLSRLVSIDRRVYHSADARSLVNLKWQKTLIQQSSGQFSSVDNFKQELNVPRIFRRVYSDVLDLFNRYESQIQDVYKGNSLEDKILMLEAMCRVGYHDRAIIIANEWQDSQFELDLNQVSKQHFASLINLFNNIGIFIANDNIKEILFKKLELNIKLQESNQLNYGLRYSIDATNYLLQNHRNNFKFDNIYSRYLNTVQSKAIYYTPADNDNDDVIQAFRILALQIPEKYGSHPIYLNYLSNYVNDRYKINPFHSILRQTCYKWVRKQAWLKRMQEHLIVGVKNGVENALIFSTSDQTSLDGEIRSGDLNSFIIRLEHKNNMSVHQLSVNSFLNITYEKQQIFKLKPLKFLQQKFSEFLFTQQHSFETQFKQIVQMIEKVLQVYPSCLISNQINFKIAVLNNLFNSYLNVQTKEQECTNRTSILLEVLELNKLLLLMDQSSILKQVIQKPDSSIPLNSRLIQPEPYPQEKLVEVDVEGTRSILRTIKTNIPQLVKTISYYLQQIAIKLEKTSPKLKGQRQSLQVLEKEQVVQTDLSVQFINYRYFTDSTYCQYRDWKERIQQKFKIVQINYDGMSNFSKILTNKFCSGIHNKLNLLPICKHEELMKRVTLQYKLLKQPTSQKENKSLQKSEPSVNQKNKKQLQYIINLQNFKHQLKITFSPKKLLDYIFGFKFIFELNKRNPERLTRLLLRQPQEYFNYLEQLNERTYIQSPYAKYILSKLSKTDKIKRLMEKRKNVRIAQRALYQQGSIGSKTYYERVGQVEDQIVKAVEELKSKLLDHMDNAILSDQMKMVDIHKDQLDSFQYIIKKNFEYNRQFDQDFICSNGNYEKALNYKRGRAQSNYIKLYLLKLIAENKTLNVKELQLLKSWEEEIARGVNQFTVSEQFTTMLVSQVPWEDLQSLKLRSSTLNSNKDMLLIDLIMEFNLFLDDSLIHSYQKQFKAQIISKKYNVPLFLFEQSATVGFKRLQNEVEEAIINEKSQLTKEDINSLQQIFKIFKIQGFRQRNRYQVLCSNFKENVYNMNESIVRTEIIQEYIKHLEEEFMKQYNPKMIKEIKQKQTDKLWREVFHHPYDHCNKDQLKQVSKKLILRLELLEQRVPPFFGNLLLKLLMHPNTDFLTKESLIAALQYYKFDLNIDSSEIQAISRLDGRKVRNSFEVKSDLKNISQLKVGRMLREKAQRLLL